MPLPAVPLVPPALVPLLPALPGSSPLPIDETPPHAANVLKLTHVIHLRTVVGFIGNPSFLQSVIPAGRAPRSRKQQLASARRMRALWKAVQQALRGVAGFAGAPQAIAGFEA